MPQQLAPGCPGSCPREVCPRCPSSRKPSRNGRARPLRVACPLRGDLSTAQPQAPPEPTRPTADVGLRGLKALRRPVRQTVSRSRCAFTFPIKKHSDAAAVFHDEKADDNDAAFVAAVATLRSFSAGRADLSTPASQRRQPSPQWTAQNSTAVSRYRFAGFAAARPTPQDSGMQVALAAAAAPAEVTATTRTSGDTTVVPAVPVVSAAITPLPPVVPASPRGSPLPPGGIAVAEDFADAAVDLRLSAFPRGAARAAAAGPYASHSLPPLKTGRHLRVVPMASVLDSSSLSSRRPPSHDNSWGRACVAMF